MNVPSPLSVTRPNVSVSSTADTDSTSLPSGSVSLVSTLAVSGSDAQDLGRRIARMTEVLAVEPLAPGSWSFVVYLDTAQSGEAEVRLPDGTVVAAGTPECNRALSELTGRDVELCPLVAPDDRDLLAALQFKFNIFQRGEAVVADG